MAIDIVIQGDYKDRDIKRAQRDLDLLGKQSGITGSAFTKMSAIGVGMGVAVGAAAIQAAAAGARMAVTFGVDGVKAFLDDEAAAARLAKTMENLGMEGATAAVETTIDSLARMTGTADDLLRPAMDRLLRAVGNVDEANKLLSLSLDVAGGTGRSLDSVVQALGRAFDGNTTGLSRLGAGLDKATLKTGDMDVITKQLADTFGGQAAVKAASFQGQIDRVSVAFGELQESFGQAFMEGVASNFSEGTDAGDALSQSINDLTPAIVDLGTQLGNLVANTPRFVEFIKGFINDFAVLRDQTLLVVAAFKAFIQITRDRDIEGAQKTLADANAALAVSMDARTEAYTKAFASETGLKTATSATVSAALAAGAAITGATKSHLVYGEVLTQGKKIMNDYSKATDGAADSVGGSASSATVKVYKYAEAIKAAQKATDDGVKSFNDYASSVSGSITGLLSIDDAATLFADRNDAVKTALKDLVDYQATLSAEQTDAERKKVTELQAIYQTAQTQAAEGGASIVDTFVKQAERVSEFGAKMRQLLAAGLNETSFREISAMNLENGIRTADAFLDGNIQENIRRTNEAVGSVKSIADQVGLDAAKQFATAGIQMAVSMIEALLEVIGSKGKGRKALLSMMDDLAAAMNRTSYINVVTTSSGQGGVAPGVTPTMSPVEASNLADFLAGGIGSPEGGFFPGFANGGPVLGGRPIIVGEKGPELFVPGSNGNVVPNHAMGGNTYQITVQAGVGDPRAIGQSIVEYVRKFEQANGPVFRGSMTIRAQIAFDLSLTTGVNFFTLDDVDKGVLDNTEYVLGGDALIDVTEYLRSVQVDRGRSRTLEKFTAGQANIELDNRTRIFDPTYAPGPYFGQILPRKQLVIDEDGEEIFSGFVEDWNYAYPAGGFDAVAEVSASDGFTILAQQTMTAGTQVAQLSGPRVTAVLDAAGWSSVKRDIGPGQSLLDADVVAATTNVLSYLQLVETSEFGALFIGRQGALTFRDRSELQAFTTGITFGPTGIPYRDISVVWGTEEMKNTVSVTFTAGDTVAGTALTEDAASQAAYGVIDQTITTILSSSVEASALSSWLVGLYSQPQYRVDTLTVSLDGITAGQKASVLDLELGDVVTVGFTPSSIGSAISQIVSIDKISHQALPDRHDVTFTLSEALAAFILDDAVFGVLDDDILGF